MNDLERRYAEKQSAYEILIASGNPNVEEVRKLNNDIRKILDDMLIELAKVKEDAGHIEEYRNDLVKKLVAIQKDYNELLHNKDQLATLKKMHGHQVVTFNATFYGYAFGLAVVSILFFFVLMWKGGYKVPAMPMTTSSATTIDPFMYR